MSYLNIKDYNRPDENALLCVLEQNSGTCAELVIRLAWNAGMNIPEIQALKWEQVSFAENQFQITLPNRTIPLEGALLQCLQKWKARFFKRSPEYVVISDFRHVRLSRVSLSRLISGAFKAGGIEGLSMTDLRQDYVIRLMEQHDLPYVSRVSGLKIDVLKINYSQYIRPTVKTIDKKAPAGNVSNEQMISLVKAEGVPLGIVIWLYWQQGLSLSQIVALTWNQVDLHTRILSHPTGFIFIDDTLEELLQKAYSIREPGGDPHLILTPKSKKPFDVARLSRVVRMALIRWGIEDLSISQLVAKKRKKTREEQILQYLEKNKYMTMNQVKKLFQGSGYNLAYNCIQRMKDQGEVVMVGRKYYLPGTVVAPEQQYEVICTHLKEKGSAGLRELAELLGIEYKQCLWILKGMLKEGKLAQKNQKYTLP